MSAFSGDSHERLCAGDSHERQLPAGHRRGDRQLPGRAVHREGRAGRRQPARVDAPRAAGRAGRPGLRRRRQLAGDRRLRAGTRSRPAGATGDNVRAVAATSMREGIVLYDAAGREIWACPNVDSRSGQEAVELIAEGAAERIYALGGDWVSITTPARLRWLARHRPDILAADQRPGHAQRLDRDPAVRRAGDRAVLRVELGDVQPGRPDVVGRRSRRSAACRASVLPPVHRPRHRDRHGHRGGRGADRPAGRHAGRRGRRRHAARAARRRRQTGRVHGRRPARSGRTRSCSTGRSSTRRSGCGRCATSCRPVDAGGDRLLLRDEHALVPRRVLRRRGRAGPPPRRRSLRRHGGSGRAGAAGLGGVLAILSNVMNARRWAHASPSFLQFDLGDQAGPARGQAACVRAIEEAAAYVARGHRDIITELTGISFSRAGVHRRRGQGHALAADHRRRARRAGAASRR